MRAALADRRGAVAVLTSLCLMALLACAAVGVDLGQVFVKSRQLQGVADLAAMASVQSLDPSSSLSPAQTATATAALNPWPGGIAAQTATGVYTPNPGTPAAQRFVVSAITPNAVQVSLTASAPLYFAGLITGRSSLQLTRTAVAARAQYAAFSIGSGLASLNGGVANALLSAMTGSQVQLSVANYQALASAQVDLLQYLPALQAREGLQAGGFNQLLAASVAPSVALSALADTLAASGQSAAAASAQSLAAAAAPLAAVPLGSLFNLGPYAAQDHAVGLGQAAVGVNAMSLADALIQAADGSRQLSLTLDGLAPGLAHLGAWLAVGQRPSQSPWLTVTDEGQVVVSTAQMRLYLQAGLAPGALSSVTQGALLTLPVYVEAASAQASLQAMQCPADPTAQGLDLSVSPSLGTLAVAQTDAAALNAFATPVVLSPASLFSTPLASATAYGRVSVGGGQASWQDVHFTQADITAGTMKSVFTSDIARASVASLLGYTAVTVQAGPASFGVAPGGLSPAVQVLLVQAAPAMDAVIGQIEAISGVRLGEADVWANGLRCRGAALVA